MNDTRNKKELSVKNALAADIATLKFRSTVIIAPDPLPFIPATPFVIGKAIFNYAKKLTASVKKSID